MFVPKCVILSKQVTNPAIDPLRENLVMSLDMTLGKKGNIVEAVRQECESMDLIPHNACLIAMDFVFIKRTCMHETLTLSVYMYMTAPQGKRRHHQDREPCAQ
jgi:glutamate synthase (ferredoxin)